MSAPAQSEGRSFAGSIPEVYDTLMGPMMFEPFARDLAARLSRFSGDILEVACGTGRVTRALAEAAPAARITATDLAPAMLAKARALDTSANVTFQEADAQALPFPDEAFGAVVCQFGMMFLPDKAAGYFEARRVLRPGGLYLFSVWDALEANDLSLIVHETIAALYADDPPDFYRRLPFGYHDGPAIRAAVEAAGFVGVRIETITLPTPAPSALDAARAQCLGTPLRNELEARGGEAALEAAVQACAEAIERRFGGGAIEGQGQALLVTATTP